MSLPTYPRLAPGVTVVPDGEALYLVAGEDARYALRTGSLTVAVALALSRCDGMTAAREVTEDGDVRKLLDRLASERLILDGPAVAGHVAARYRLCPEGSARWANRLASGGEGEPLAVLCQDTLDYAAAVAFNRRMRLEKRPFLWVTTGPAARGYVGPAFVPDAGPCLECVIATFGRLSPTPGLFDALMAHDGPFAAAAFPEDALAVLESVARWKATMLAEAIPPESVFRLHVLECDTREVMTHRVWRDPTCAGCAR